MFLDRCDTTCFSGYAYESLVSLVYICLQPEKRFFDFVNSLASSKTFGIREVRKKKHALHIDYYYFFMLQEYDLRNLPYKIKLNVILLPLNVIKFGDSYKNK